MHGRPTRLVDSPDDAAIDEDMMKEDMPAASIYYHEGGELFAEDVEQQMAVLPEVKIEDVQVGDPGIPLSEDQEDL